jgi:hypothetical protein
MALLQVTRLSNLGTMNTSAAFGFACLQWRSECWKSVLRFEIYLCSHIVLVLGRPRMVSVSDCTIKTPIDCNIPQDSLAVIPNAIDEHAVPSNFSPVLFLHHIGRSIHEMLTSRADKSPIEDYGIVQG